MLEAVGETKIQLPESEIPTRWYNIASDMPNRPQPVLHPGTGEPVGPDDLAPLFPMELILQEVSTDAEVAIPDEVLDIYRLWRPTPLYRAERLERAIGTRSRIFYKYEGVSPAGSHKPNTAVAQAYYNKAEGRRRLSTETGAGQWGSALAFACKLVGLECKVYMVKVSYEQKPFRRSLMHVWGAEVVASPSDETESGRKVLAEHPDSPGSLGIAISEAVEDAASRDDTAYSLGSVLNHVLLHQTVIGQEALEQMELAGEFPDVVIGCVGGGSNFAGLAFPFLREKIAGKEIDVLACEPSACPTLTRGPFAYDFGDTAGLTPLVPMHTLGHDFVPAPIHSRRPALPRRRAADLAAGGTGRSAPRPTCRRTSSRRPLNSPARKGSFRRRSPRTPSTGLSASPIKPTRRERRRRSCSTSPAMATSIWPRTTASSPESSRTSRSTKPRSSAR